MMRFNIFTIFALIALLSSWLAKATEDGKITLDEVFDLLSSIARLLGLEMDKDLVNLKKN